MRLRRWLRRRGQGLDVRAVAIRHHIRGHQGEALLCAECVADSKKEAQDA